MTDETISMSTHRSIVDDLYRELRTAVTDRRPRRLTDDEIGQIWFNAKIPGLVESDARRLIRAAEAFLGVH